MATQNVLHSDGSNRLLFQFAPVKIIHKNLMRSKWNVCIRVVHTKKCDRDKNSDKYRTDIDTRATIWNSRAVIKFIYILYLTHFLLHSILAFEAHIHFVPCGMCVRVCVSLCLYAYIYIFLFFSLVELFWRPHIIAPNIVLTRWKARKHRFHI